MPSLRVPVSALLSSIALAGPACGLDTLQDTDVGDMPRCEAAKLWPVPSAEQEQALFAAINDLRIVGATCGDEDLVGVRPLELIPELHCAARLHAADLVRNADSVTHTGSDGSTSLSRANLSGYDGIARQELLAVDFTEPDDLISAWQNSEVHCRAVLDPTLEHVGIGEARTSRGDRIVWVVVTGQQRR